MTFGPAQKQQSPTTTLAPLPAPPDAVTDTGSAPSDKVFAQTSDGLEEVAIPAPKSQVHDDAQTVAVDHVPTIEDVLAPETPSLDGASFQILADLTTKTIEDLYEKTLIEQRLKAIESTLARTRPPPANDFAMQALILAVQTVASTTLGMVGQIAVHSLFESAPKPAGSEPAFNRSNRRARTKAEIEQDRHEAFQRHMIASTTNKNNPNEARATTVATKGADLAGAIVAKLLAEAPDDGGLEDPSKRFAPGDSLLREFIERQAGALRQRKHKAIATILMAANSAAAKGADFASLDRAIQNLFTSADLMGWFTHKVAMEWLNFSARASVGPSLPDQATEFAGANTIGGIASGGQDAAKQWHAANGFIEIRIKTPDTVQGLTGVSVDATIPSSIGAAAILKDAHTDVDRHGKPLNLATLPVYRRVWISTGRSKLNQSPAFIITPDGAVEVDVGNPILAAIGSGQRVTVGDAVHLIGGDAMSEHERHNPEAWLARATTASQCTVGAHDIYEMLRSVKPEVLQ